VGTANPEDLPSQSGGKIQKNIPSGLKENGRSEGEKMESTKPRREGGIKIYRENEVLSRLQVIWSKVSDRSGRGKKRGKSRNCKGGKENVG